jgi:TetR/AcrR family transcriptional repressor of nem operon
MLVVRYTEGFAGALQRIMDGVADAPARLRAYVKLYADVLADERMCLCGMVAAEYGTLPVPIQQALRLFFEFNEAWLARLLEQGNRDGSLRLEVAPLEAARMLVGALEGAMLVARAYGDPARFVAASRLLLGQLESGAGRRARLARAGVHPRLPARARAAARVKGLATPRARRR